MKKLLLVTGVVLALGLAIVGLASADGGPHGGYTPTTDACAGCHRAHTAVAPRLLTVPVGSLCMSCHGSTATGADTNVEDGVYLDRDAVTEAPAEGTPNLGLRGGGFRFAQMDTDFTAAISTSVTSNHTYDGVITGTVWGNGAIGSGPGLANFSLECTNCHDPHGNGNYRILRPIPRNSGAAVAVNVPDEATKNYTIADAGGQYFGEGYNLAAISTTPMTPQYEGVSDWCAQCHTRYLADPDSATTDSGDAIFTYRHMTADTFAGGGDCTKCHGSPFVTPPPITYNANYWNHDVECMTCHVAHGTSASMSTGPYSGSVLWPDGASTPSGDNRSSLLRVDGRGVCQACHNKPGTPTP
jgi:predicted CXXCH cytochrome family protein